MHDPLALRGRPALATVGSMLLLLAAAPAGDKRSFGVWSNPRAAFTSAPSRAALACAAWSSWANDKAKVDAERGGTPELVGQRLFRDFQPAGEGVWRGKVFVPDIAKTFSGTISVIDETHLEGKGCLLGNIGCRSQIWTRIGD